MSDKYVPVCPYCGGTEVIETVQGNSYIIALSNRLGGTALYHTVCKACGSVIRSYVQAPEKLLKKKDRR
jgi:transcription initiation factor TFIIIB Brf1 subunit/transcription initiation factor TFIIB